MRETGIGRVLVASLHQAIADILPSRLAFYENWLHAEGLRDGTIGLAPFYAVLSFLREEGHNGGEAYRTITTRAGEYAAEWSVQSMGSTRRMLVKTAPAWLRRRLVLRAAREIVRECYGETRATSRFRGASADVHLRMSIFCTVRERMPYPLCGFYAAAFSKMLELFDLRAHTNVVSCRGAGGAACELQVELLNGMA